MNLVSHVTSLLREIEEKEAAARRARNLPPDHVLTLDEFPFAFAVEELKQLAAWCAEQIAARGDIDILWYARAMASHSLRDYAAANEAMAQWQKLMPQQAEASLRFGETPPPTQLSLPAVQGAMPKQGGIFVGCDRVFFKSFAAALLRSIAANAPGMQVHVHLMGTDLSCLDRVRNLPLDLTISHEDCDPFLQQSGIKASHYYGAVRLIRFADAAQASDRPLWLIDADALAVRSPRPLLDMPEQLALRVRPGRIEPWHQFSACLVQGSRRSADYFRRVSDILKASFPQPWWGVDQHALFSAFIALHPPVTLIGPDIAGVNHCDPGAMFWYYSGNKKWKVLEDPGPYGSLFRHYFNQASTRPPEF